MKFNSLCNSRRDLKNNKLKPSRVNISINFQAGRLTDTHTFFTVGEDQN